MTVVGPVADNDGSGPVAQLGARFHGMEEVIGSIPIRSTKYPPSKLAAFLTGASLLINQLQRMLFTLADGSGRSACASARVGVQRLIDTPALAPRMLTPMTPSGCDLTTNVLPHTDL